MGRKRTFRDLIAANKLKSFLLMFLFCFFCALFTTGVILGFVAIFKLAAMNWVDGFTIGGIAAAIALVLAILGAGHYGLLSGR